MSNLEKMVFEPSNIHELFQYGAHQLNEVVSALKVAGNEPNIERKIIKLFSVSVVAKLCGDKSETWVRNGVKSGKFPCALRNKGGESSRFAFSQAELWDIIQLANKKNHLCLNTKKALVVSFPQYKGGVGKTTNSVSFASMQALRGRRVLFIDLDAQCSGTEILYSSSIDEYTKLTYQETIYGALTSSNPDSIKDVILNSGFKGLDHIPAGIDVSRLDTLFTNQINSNNTLKYWEILQDKIKAVQHDYDLIVIDCPPAINLLNANSVWTADLLVMPVAANMMDVSALAKFFEHMGQMFGEIAKIVGKEGIPKSIGKILISNFDGNPKSDPREKQKTKSSDNKRLKMDDGVVKMYLNRMLPGVVLNTTMVRCEAFKVATNNFKTVAELDISETDPDGARKYPISQTTYNRAFNCISEICDELEPFIQTLANRQVD